MLHKLNKTIQAVAYYVSNHITLADFAILAVTQSFTVRPSCLLAVSVVTNLISALPLFQAGLNDADRVSFLNICRFYDQIQHQAGFHGKLDQFVLKFALDVQERPPKEVKEAPKKEAKDAAPKKEAGDKKAQAKPAGDAQPAKEKPAKQAGGGGGGKQQPKKEEEVVDISRVDLRVGKIVECKRHPTAEKLYVESIDLGEEKPRTIVSGLVQFVPLDKMQNRLVVVVCNLKPAKLQGIESAGMVLAASNDDHTQVEIVDPPAGAKAGERITFAGYTGTPDDVLNPKKKIFETVKPDLKSNGEKVACYKDVAFMTSAGPCTVATLANSHLG